MFTCERVTNTDGVLTLGCLLLGPIGREQAHRLTILEEPEKAL